MSVSRSGLEAHPIQKGDGEATAGSGRVESPNPRFPESWLASGAAKAGS